MKFPNDTDGSTRNAFEKFERGLALGRTIDRLTVKALQFIANNLHDVAVELRRIADAQSDTPGPPGGGTLNVSTTPAALALAESAGLTHEDVEGLKGSGEMGRVLVTDVQAEIDRREAEADDES